MSETQLFSANFEGIESIENGDPYDRHFGGTTELEYQDEPYPITERLDSATVKELAKHLKIEDFPE